MGSKDKKSKSEPWQEIFSGRIDSEPELSFLSSMYSEFPESEWYLVGGAVRDIIMDRKEIKDYDFLVRNVDLDDLSEALGKIGRVDLVGRNFGVLKFRPEVSDAKEEIDIAWPRTERAGMSGGYRDFEVQSDPTLEVEKDLARRDFTMNSMAWDIRKGILVDPFGGQADIADMLVRAVGSPEKRFAEDYSRILRAVRQACQTGFRIEEKTWESVRRMSYHVNDERPNADGIGMEWTVPRETVAREMVKAFRAGCSRALDLLEESGLLFHAIPELKRMVGCRQRPEHHAEGDVWTHTKMTVAALDSDGFREFFPGEDVDVETVFAALLHDSGKPTVRCMAGVQETYGGHDEAGAVIAESAVERLRLSSVPGGFDCRRVVWMIQKHMFPLLVDLDSVRRSVLEEIFLKDPVAGRGLLHLSYADQVSSRPEEGERDLSGLRRLMDLMEDIRGNSENSCPSGRLMSGEEVMAISNISPGPEVGRILDDVREAQLCGDISSADQARDFVRKFAE